jgi:hypothetical protein
VTFTPSAVSQRGATSATELLNDGPFRSATGRSSEPEPFLETRLQYFDFATRRSTTVARNLGNVYLGLTASRDGRTIFYSRIDSSVDDLMLVENFQ